MRSRLHALGLLALLAATPGGASSAVLTVQVPSAESRGEAAALLGLGLSEGFFGSFWTGFRQSFATSVQARVGGDLPRIERLTEEIVMPAFRDRRPELEAQMQDVLASQFTPAQLREMQRLAAGSDPAPLRAAIGPALPSLQAAVRVWAERVMGDNRERFVAEFRTRGVGR